MSTQALKAVATGQGATERASTIFDFLEHAKVRKGITAVRASTSGPIAC